jgi:hypothetical protein
MSVIISKLIDKLDLIKDRLKVLNGNVASSHEHEKHKIHKNHNLFTDSEKIYINYCGREFLKDLETLDTEIVTMIDAIKDSDTDLSVEIQNKQQESINSVEFLKTFSPYIILHNLGLIQRNW